MLVYIDTIAFLTPTTNNSSILLNPGLSHMQKQYWRSINRLQDKLVFAAFGYTLFKSILVCIFGHRKSQTAKLKAKYCIDSNKRPALYCRKRVLNWWCIWIFSKFVALYNQVFAQNVDFWKPKKWRTIHHQDWPSICIDAVNASTIWIDLWF